MGRSAYRRSTVTRHKTTAPQDILGASVDAIFPMAVHPGSTSENRVEPEGATPKWRLEHLYEGDAGFRVLDTAWTRRASRPKDAWTDATH